jgi:phosphoribosylaminoimidazole-succinocarboxamide synthase
MSNGFQGLAGQTVPEMTDEVVERITQRYIELYEHITGEKFQKAASQSVLSRIEGNVKDYLTSSHLYIKNISSVLPQ